MMTDEETIEEQRQRVLEALNMVATVVARDNSSTTAFMAARALRDAADTVEDIGREWRRREDAVGA